MVLLLILFVSVSYFLQIPGISASGDDPSELIELRSKDDAWQSAKPLSYRYIVERSCTCGTAFTAPYVASEERGRRTATYNVAVESDDGAFLNVPPEPVWIVNIFAQMRTAVELHGATVVDVNYDDFYGFPTAVSIHYPRPGVEIHYQIRDFEVLEHR